MTNWLMVENEGEIDPLGLRLLGASTKRGDTSKIGFFGTGWKYAQSVLLRHGVDICIFSGETVYQVKTRSVSLRGQTFDEVIIVGSDGTETPTGVTTEIGPKWELWMALREVICNALDEPGGHFDIPEFPAPMGMAGRTRVFLDLAALQSVWDERDKYFRLDDKTLIEKLPDGSRILKKTDEKTRVYRKGILVFEDKTESKFDYDCPNLSINEERLASGWDIKLRVWDLLNKASVDRKKEVLREMKQFEKALPEGWMNVAPSWAEALGDETVVSAEQAEYFRKELEGEAVAVLPDAWVTAMRKNATVKTAERVISAREKKRAAKKVLDGVQRRGLRGALRVLRRVGIDLTMDDVAVVPVLPDPNLLGRFEHGKIVLAKQLLDTGLRSILMHIIPLTIEKRWGARWGSADSQFRLLGAMVDVIGKATKSEL